jgi:riboflavin kinase / FMN adenylyltransferase
VTDLIRGLGNLRPRHRGCVATLGAFDGLHLGHRALIGAALRQAAAKSAPALMLSFEPMPREYLNPDSPPARLTNFRERWRLLEHSGLDALCLLRFGEPLRSMSGEAFLEMLRAQLQVVALVVGHDFRFGRTGAATAATMEAAGRRLGFEVTVLPAVLSGIERASSSAVREALGLGDFDRAAVMLGRRYTMRGRVVKGEQLGRRLGYPTANMRIDRRRSPLGGVFAVRAHGIAPGPLAAVASLGTRPTVDGVEPLLETHVFDFDGDLYGREIEIEFVGKIRDEERFDGLDALVAQMHRDAAAAREILAA